MENYKVINTKTGKIVAGLFQPLSLGKARNAIAKARGEATGKGAV